MNLQRFLRVSLQFSLLPLVGTSGLAQDGVPLSKMIEVPERARAKRLSQFVAPALPQGAIGKCSNAMVVLKITIDESGVVGDEEYISAYPELKNSALAALKQWTYKPSQQGGRVSAVQTQVSIFHLGDGESFPVFSPNERGGVKGGNMILLPPACGSGPSITRLSN